MEIPKLTDWIQAISACVGTFFGIVILFQNNRNLKELQRQNSISSAPILLAKVEILETSIERSKDQSDQLSLVSISPPNCGKAVETWIDHCSKVGLPPGSSTNLVILEVFNDGKSSITRIKLTISVSLQHNSSAKEDYRSEPFSGQDSIDLEIELRPGITKKILVMRINPVAKLDVAYKIESFVDSRAQTHVDNSLMSLLSLEQPTAIPESKDTLVERLTGINPASTVMPQSIQADL